MQWINPESKAVAIELVISAIAAVGSVSAVLVSFINGRRIQEVHLSLNSRLDQLVLSTGLAKHAEGVQEERDRNARQQSP